MLSKTEIFEKNELGATLTETCLLVALTVVVCISSIGLLGSQAQASFETTCLSMKEVRERTSNIRTHDIDGSHACRAAASNGHDED